MPNYGYHFARAQGSATRRAYAAMLPTLLRRPLEVAGDLPLDVYAYSGEAALPEQVASIRSFLKNAGRPRTFTVVSDGTYSQRSLELLRRLDRSVAVSQAADWIPDKVPADVLPYLRDHPTGKQLALIMSLPAHRPALYVDSDVLFFPGAANLRLLADIEDVPAFYLADCQLSADERLFRGAAEQERPVNTGVLLLFRKLDWSLSLERFRELNAAPTFFTNQTMTHLTMHANGARPFDPRTFVLQLDDQFIYRDSYAGADLVLRHYVNPVRHKFWTSLWR
jgi:hypothetical protein